MSQFLDSDRFCKRIYNNIGTFFIFGAILAPFSSIVMYFFAIYLSL